jgi:hypothetical protein
MIFHPQANVLWVFLLLTSAPAFAQSQDSTTASNSLPADTAKPVTPAERFRLFLGRAYGPAAAASNILSAGVQTWRNSPPEWGATYGGFSKRLGIRYYRGTVNSSVEMGVGFLLHDDTRYHAAGSGGISRRAGHAAVSAFVARDAKGHRIPAYSRFAGVVAGNFAVMPHYPDGWNTWDKAMIRSASQLGTRAAWNLLREFWPDLRGKLGR